MAGAEPGHEARARRTIYPVITGGNLTSDVAARVEQVSGGAGTTGGTTAQPTPTSPTTLPTTGGAAGLAAPPVVAGLGLMGVLVVRRVAR